MDQVYGSPNYSPEELEIILGIKAETPEDTYVMLLHADGSGCSFAGMLLTPDGR